MYIEVLKTIVNEKTQRFPDIVPYDMTGPGNRNIYIFKKDISRIQVLP